MNLSFRGKGKVDKNGNIIEYEAISYNVCSLYPEILSMSGLTSESFIKKLKRKQRKEKIEKLNEIARNSK